MESDAVGSGRGTMERSRLMVETAYALWEAGDVRSMMNCFSDNVAFAVHPPSSTSFVGQGQGRAVLKRRLERFLAEYEVVDYQTVSMAVRADWIDCRIRYHYRHHKTRMEIDGRMRHLWRVVGDRIVRLDIIHDARRMGAFFDLAARSAAVQ